MLCSLLCHPPAPHARDTHSANTLLLPSHEYGVIGTGLNSTTRARHRMLELMLPTIATDTTIAITDLIVQAGALCSATLADALADVVLVLFDRHRSGIGMTADLTGRSRAIDACTILHIAHTTLVQEHRHVNSVRLTEIINGMTRDFHLVLGNRRLRVFMRRMSTIIAHVLFVTNKAFASLVCTSVDNHMFRVLA